MADRIIFLLLIIFVAVGITAYDREAVKNGKLTAIGQIVNFVGLAKEELEKRDKRDEIADEEVRTFESQSKERLQRLQEKYAVIEKQRVKLVANRQEILGKLMALIDDTKADAMNYMQGINQDQKHLKEHLIFSKEDAEELFSVIKKLKEGYQEQMDQTYFDEVDFEKSHVKIESRFKSLVEELIRVTGDDLKNLIFMYQELEAEEKMFIDSIQEKQNYWQQQHRYFMHKLKEKMVKLKRQFDQNVQQEKLGNIVKTDKEKIINQDELRLMDERSRDLEYKQKNMVQQMQQNSENMKRIIKTRFKANRIFVEEISSLIDIDLRRLVTDKNYAIQRNATYIRDRRAMQRWDLKKSKYKIDEQDLGNLGVEMKSGLTQSPELRKTDFIRQKN